MGMLIAYFYSLTPRQFINIQRGYLAKTERRAENDWLQTKVLSYFIYSSIPKKKGKSVKSFTEFADTFFNVKEEYKIPVDDVDKIIKTEKAVAFFNRVDKNKNGKP